MNNYTPTAFSREATSRIKGLIARFDVNQADLAVLCDVSQSQFSKMVRGVRPMTIDQLAVTLDALGQDISVFVSEIDDFLSERAESPSPIQYVVDDERDPAPEPFGASMLDAWGRAALARIAPENVGGPEDDEVPTRKSDAALAARKRAKDRGETPEAP